MASIMYQSTATATAPATESLAKRESLLRGVHFGWMVVGIVALLFIAGRLYQGAYGWSAGLDSTTAEFQTYWMNVFWAEVVFWPIFGTAVLGYLWITRDRHIDKVTPVEEMRRSFVFVGWVLVLISTFGGAAFFAELDATWHQTVVRDTSFTPSHVFLFYGILPFLIILSMGTLMYMVTRLPVHAAGLSVPMAIIVSGVFLILPNLGYNEWGHAFWLMEETFGAPLHWGFVLFVWVVLSFGGVFGQMLKRWAEIYPLVYGDEAKIRLTK